MRAAGTTTLAQSISAQLRSNQYECVNCLEVIRYQAATWSCSSCFRVIHLQCIKKWARSEESGEGSSFRCPHCQTLHKSAKKYFCFCGRTVDPLYDPSLTPHCCGELCGKSRGSDCPHACPLLCHPGPCPECLKISPERGCPCGATTYSFQCGKTDPKITCDGICSKSLPCGKHRCSLKCHSGPCQNCTQTGVISCVCGRCSKELPCQTAPFSCDEPCGKLQRCGNHHCNVTCHSGACPLCDTDPSAVHTCPCRQQPLIVQRVSCLDAIPVCDAVCGKVLACSNHFCSSRCHLGPCSPCQGKITAKCRCGSQTSKLYCAQQENNYCHKKCKTRLSCGKHECEKICCVARNNMTDANHTCTKTCNKKLSCGHSCSSRCHLGLCSSCPNIGTTALVCRCGAQVLPPPSPCGSAPPPCSLPCQVPLPCGHSSAPHDCHWGECPPCCTRVDKQCIGGHRTISNVLCHLSSVTCSSVCGKVLSCGHLCNVKCHSGPCVEVGLKGCHQVCGKPLGTACGHDCNRWCHPSTACGKCTNTVEISCKCGLQKKQSPCFHEQSISSQQEVQFECTDDCLYTNRLSILAARAKKKVVLPSHSDPSSVSVAAATKECQKEEMAKEEWTPMERGIAHREVKRLTPPPQRKKVAGGGQSTWAQLIQLKSTSQTQREKKGEGKELPIAPNPFSFIKKD